MGRRDAVQVMLEVVAECRRLLPSLIVTWEPGWETRGNGSQANYDFANIHHTASASSAARPFPTQTTLVKGRPDLTGPLCNVAQPWCTVDKPRLHVVAAHPANHAGASRASGPVPALSLYNPRTLGDEIDYAGTVPMSDGQLLVGHVFTLSVANVLAGGNVEVVRGHYETSITGKIDPAWGGAGKSYNMADWRRAAASISAPPAPAAPVPVEVATVRSVQLTADNPVALLTIDPVGASAVLPAGKSAAWVQWGAFFPGHETAVATMDWWVYTVAGKPAVPVKPFQLGHRASGSAPLPVGCNGVEIRAKDIPPGAVIGVHVDAVGHA